MQAGTVSGNPRFPILQPMSKPRKLICVADDSEITRALLRALFNKTYDIIEASNGADVIRILRSSERPLSALLLDMRMPEMDGWNVLQFLKDHQLAGKFPVICITAISDTETKIRCYEEGCAEVIEKPFNERLLVTHVQSIIERHSQNSRAGHGTEWEQRAMHALALLDAISVAIISFDAVSRSIRYVNTKGAAFFPNINNPVGHTLDEGIPQNDLELFSGAVREVLTTRRQNVRLYHAPNGNIYSVVFNALLDVKGNISEIVASLRDVTAFVQRRLALEAKISALNKISTGSPDYNNSYYF